MTIRTQNTCPLMTGFLLCCAMAMFATISLGKPQNRTARASSSIPKADLIQIIKAEDERRWDNDLRSLLSNKNSAIRSRAALAAGRIGQEDAVSELTKLLQQDANPDVRAMAAFAIGEIEAETGAPALLLVLQDRSAPAELRARSLEALGKIAGALPKDREPRARELGAAVLETLKSERQRSAPDKLTILLGLTAALRSKPANAGPVIAGFLSYKDPRIRADAANALSRLRAKDGNEQLRKLLTTDPDGVVRANAARVLGVTEDKASLDALLDRALNDTDSRARVSAIRALGSLKDASVTEQLLKHALDLSAIDRQHSGAVNELLEIAAVTGRLLQGKENQAALGWLRTLRAALGNTAPEVEVAFARISPTAYLSEFGDGASAKRRVQETILLNWRAASSVAEGLGEIATLPDSVTSRIELATAAAALLRAMLDYRNSGLVINTLVAVHSEFAVPDVLRALAAFKPKDLSDVLRAQLGESDVIIRATAAELLGELPPSDAVTHALLDALPRALKDDLDDAALAILDSLAKQKSAAATDAIKSALDSNDYLVRRGAVALLKTNGIGDFSRRIGAVQTRNTVADYERAISRMGKPLHAIVSTTKGSFTIQLLPDEATLNVDNFVQLAKRNYFNNITFHRVVPNFVIQGGDPRGDGNGGPGYQIRCEINEIPFDRAAVGMALSGKDTGGSQWFVTHAPQPHLDGGYTVFGRVIAGMDIVDNIARGDVIRSIVISQKR